ncbi:MAG: hypothetical protein Q9168_005070 [Polycauliona sp. 1 TL-2023]
MPFFTQLRKWRSTSAAALPQVQVGIISNSDGQRVSSVLDDLGLRVNGKGHDTTVADSEKSYDLDWVVTSFDSGYEKPSHKIFDIARALSASRSGGENEYLHVGDNNKEDYHGALEAGWQSVILDRDGKCEGEIPEPVRVPDLTTLMQRLMGRKKS